MATSDLTGLVLLPAWFASTWVIKRGRRMRVAAGERVLAQFERAPISSCDRSTPTSRSPTDLVVTGAGVAVGALHHARAALARTLRKVGPFVAVGDPTEELPQLGAARVYAADEDWQATVDEWTARAGVVLLQTGESEGLAWECSTWSPSASRARNPVAAAGCKRKGRSPQERYDAFRPRFGDVFPRGLPESIGHCLFAYFNSDWTPRLLGKRGVPLPAGDAPRDVALRRLAREFKIMWGPR